MKKVTALLIYLLFQFTWMTVAQVLLIEIFSAKQSTGSNVWFANILILLLFPELMMMGYDIWMSNVIALKSYNEWPEIKILINGAVMSIIDAMALGFLTTIAFPKLPPLLLSGIFYLGLSPANDSFNVIFPSDLTKKKNNTYCHLQIYGNYKQENGKDRTCFFSGRKCILPIIQFLLTISITTSLVLGNIMNITIACFFGLSIIMLNLTRSTPLQNHIFKTDNKQVQNAGILYRFLRIVILILSVYIAFMQNNENHETSISLLSITSDVTIFKITVVCACVLLGQIDSYIPKLSSPMVIMTMIGYFCITLTVSIFVLCVYFVHNSFNVFENIKSFPVSFSVNHIVLYLCTCLSVVLFYFATFHDIYKGKYCTRKSVLVSYDNVFSCQNLIIKILRKPKCIKKSKHSRVFVCTTMYQESASEMRRLLCSLKKIRSSKAIKDRKMYIECHIFLDNGANEKKVKSFGIKLLTLICETLMMEEKYGTMINTPYGIRFSWNVPGQAPLFLHLKDSSLVQAKKRWSQIMYMKYILQYREKELHDVQKPTNPVNSFYSVPSDLVDGEADFTSNVQRSENDAKARAHTVISCRSNTKVSSATQLAEKEGNGMHRSLDSTEYYFSGNQNQEIVLRVPRRHLTTKNRRSSFDHSFISQQNSASTHNWVDSHFQKKSSDDFSHPSFQSSFFYQFENHKDMNNRSKDRQKRIQGNTLYQDFILATDSDMAFDDQSVINLLETIEKDTSIGGVCGRTVPISVRSHPIVWLQKFEYAKDFLMGKSAQNIIGSVMCCPGCFSLYRFEALHDCMDNFSMPALSVSEVLTKDNGEDRWISTLMMKSGWTLRYSCHGYNSTFCPEETEEFMKQRRRWLLSDFANTLIVAGNLLHLMKNNTAFTVVYTLYFLQLFIVTIIGPGTTLLMLSFFVNLVTGFPIIVNAAVLSAICLAYCIVQISSLTSYKKLVFTKLLILAMGILITYVFVTASVYLVQMISTGNTKLFCIWMQYRTISIAGKM